VKKLSQDSLNEFFKKCYSDDLQVLAHANGDGAIDMVLAAHEAGAAGNLDKDRRTTVIHSQFARPDQLQQFAKLKIIPSFFTEHTFFFSDAHVLNRGKAQAASMSPMRGAIELGLRPTNHTDFNTAPIDQMFLMWSAVNRFDRNGEVVGRDERVGAIEALEAITINAAYQSFEEPARSCHGEDQGHKGPRDDQRRKDRLPGGAVTTVPHTYRLKISSRDSSTVVSDGAWVCVAKNTFATVDIYSSIDMQKVFD
jgi:hypothetical protein